MRELYDFKLSDVINPIVEEITRDKNISKSLARKLVINALSYNVVTEEIYNQVDFLMEEDLFESEENENNFNEIMDKIVIGKGGE